MTPEQLIKLRTVRSCQAPLIRGKPNDAKTLLYGYECARKTWHTYQDTSGRLYRVIYDIDDRLIDIIDGFQLDANLLVPDKRLYPEACDFEFCQELKALGIFMTFTVFGGIWRDPDTKFWGRTFT